MTSFVIQLPNRHVLVIVREPPGPDRLFEVEIGPLAHLLSPVFKAELLGAIAEIDGRQREFSGYVLERHRRFTLMNPVLVLRRADTKEAT